MDLRKYDLTPQEEGYIRKLDGIVSQAHDGMYADREGEPISLGVWTVLFGKENYKRVAYSTIGEGISVSTIWFGCVFLRLFETAIVVEDESGGRNYDNIYGWHTLEEAKAGHAALVKDLSSQIPDAVVVDHVS